MDKVAQYCDAHDAYDAVQRNERESVRPKAELLRLAHGELYGELQAAGMRPLVFEHEGLRHYVVPKVRKVVRKFDVDDVVQGLGGQAHADPEKSAVAHIVEHVLSKYVSEEPCGARVVRKLPSDAAAAAAPLRVPELGVRVASLERGIREAREATREDKRKLSRVKKQAQDDVKRVTGAATVPVRTATAAYLLKCDDVRRKRMFSAREVTRAVRGTAKEYIESNGLDEHASEATVRALSGDFWTSLEQALRKEAAACDEEESSVRIRCVRDDA